MEIINPSNNVLVLRIFMVKTVLLSSTLTTYAKKKLVGLDLKNLDHQRHHYYVDMLTYYYVDIITMLTLLLC